MTLDLRGSLVPALDDIRVERSLRKPGDTFELRGLLEEHLPELLADDAPLLLGVGHTREERQEAVLGLHMYEIDVELVTERSHHLLGLI